MAERTTIAENHGKDLVGGAGWTSVLVRSGHRFIDRVLGVKPTEVLNATDQPLKLADPARRLKEIAGLMKAEAIDPESGAVDYSTLLQSPTYAEFLEFTRALPNCNLEDLGDRNGQIAFWINVYNALILHGVIRFDIRGSMLSDLGFFRRAAYNISGMRFSADDIEHGVLRANRRHPYLPIRPFTAEDPRLMLAIRPMDPRIHFALVCGARSCPPIAFYEGASLDVQLDQAAAAFINGGGAHFEASSSTLWLSRIFRWYERDFGGRKGVLETVDRHLRDAKGSKALGRGGFRLSYQRYDWSVNAAL